MNVQVELIQDVGQSIPSVSIFLPRGLSIKIETNVFDLGGLKFVQDVRTAIDEDVISAKIAESPWHLNSKLIMTMKNMKPPLTLLAAQPKRIFGEIHQGPTCSTYSLGMYTILAGPLNRMISVHLHISLIQTYRFSTPLIESINQFLIAISLEDLRCPSTQSAPSTPSSQTIGQYHNPPGKNIADFSPFPWHTVEGASERWL